MTLMKGKMVKFIAIGLSTAAIAMMIFSYCKQTQTAYIAYQDDMAMMDHSDATEHMAQISDSTPAVTAQIIDSIVFLSLAAFAVLFSHFAREIKLNGILRLYRTHVRQRLRFMLNAVMPPELSLAFQKGIIHPKIFS